MAASCTDFRENSICALAARLDCNLLNATQFLHVQETRWNLPNGGCTWLNSRVYHWRNLLLTTTNTQQIKQRRAKIKWAECHLELCSQCPPVAGVPPISFGCMDDGSMPSTYLNNLPGCNYGSVIPGFPAVPFAILQAFTPNTEDGSCWHIPPTPGCKDPSASNYCASCMSDCAHFHVYSIWHKTVPGGYGHTSCCIP